MKIKIILYSILPLAMFLMSINAFALSSTHFTTTSKLATGKWAKIRVSETGVHEITNEQLSEMGFNDPNKVKIFGRGGHVLNEALTESLPDDLSQIPTLTTNNKVVFYAHGAVEMTAYATSSNPYHTGNVNPYSKYGYYFVTDDDSYQVQNVENAKANTTETTTEITECYDYTYYNNDFYSFLNSGKTFYGENLLDNYDLSFTMPNYIAGTPVTLAFSIGSNVDAASVVSATINDTNIPLSSNSLSRIGSYHEFEICSPVGTTSTIEKADKYSLKINIKDTGINSARLDYFSATYKKTTEFPTDSTQMRMAFSNPNSQWQIVVNNVSETIAVWDVTKGTPKAQHLLTANNGNVTFYPTTNDSWEQYVAFKPSKKLKSVHIEGVIENQDLHRLTTPDMVIIYPKNFQKYAEQLAQLHHSHDNFDVIAVEDEKIFNEFSSGAKDATAYRLLMKMLYDRNPQKLKYLLLLGCGSYDNRNICGKKSENQLLTYQSSDSYGTVSSYVTDDYFGFLADNSGKSLPTDILSISVGRIPAKTIEDAENAITKTLDYIISDNDELWRSNILILSDQGDENLHTTQAEGTEDVIQTAIGGNALHINKIYQEWYLKTNLPENNNGNENLGRNKLENLFKEGVLFTTYIGHAGPIAFTKGYRLWNSSKVKSTKYPYLPFFSIAACETAQFDNDGRSISEELILAQEGGAIGVLSAARTVYSSQNDRLNKALSQYLFTLKEDGSYRTIGEAAMEAKKSFGTSYNYNKLSFTLFGDPAIRFRFPINRCKITTINGTDVDNDNISINPLSTVNICGKVNNAEGNTDTSFNGTVTVTLYDKIVKYKDLTIPNVKDSVSESFYPREKLCHTTATVNNGTFNVNLTLPKNCLAAGDHGLITVFAKSDDNRIVSGSEENFTIAAYNSNNAISDNKAPKIAQILIDGQNAKNIIYTHGNPIISFEATDETGINTKPDDIQGAMKLIIDNGKVNIPALSNHTRAYNSGKSVKGNISLHNLSTGKHTVYLEISDVAGNTTSKEYIFYVVDDNLDCTLTTSIDVTRENVELNIETEYDITNCSLHIRDNANNTILIKEISGSYYTWDLKDTDGNRVKPGRYTLFASFNGENGSGTTAPIKIVVLGE